MTNSEKQGPLEGYRIIELAGIGPGPYCGQLLSDLGAEVIVVERPGARMDSIDLRGKRSITVDLRKEGAADLILHLVKTADALIEGNRPGVTERLGVGPDDCFAVNPKLVYGRMTGWGQEGPWSSMAGHDLNYLSITGALYAMGDKAGPPPPPLNVVGDYGGGSMFLAVGVLAALLRAQKTGEGEVVDASIIDGVSSMIHLVRSLAAFGLWTNERQSNLLDGGVPYYRCYETADQKYMAVGCIEPKFFTIMLEKLEINPSEFGDQNDQEKHAAQHAKLETIFASKPRDQWAQLFDGTDACVTPVLDYEEAAQHPHNAARQALIDDGVRVHPAAAPRFSNAAVQTPMEIPKMGGDTREVLSEAGLGDAEIDGFVDSGVIEAND